MTEDADETYDVFLSHTHTEAEAVELLATKLEDEARLAVWLDRWILVPGGHWQQEIYKVGIAGDPFAREPIERAPEILLKLQQEGRLAPQHKSIISTLREMLGAEGTE